MSKLILRVVGFLTILIYGSFVYGCEPVFMFDTDIYTLWEYDEAVEVTVSRSRDCTPAVNIIVSIESDGTNATESDFTQPSPFVVSFDAGDTEAVVTINIIDDQIAEQLEVIKLSIQSLENGTVASPASTQVSILDNDGLNVFSMEKSSYQTSEDTSVISVTVVREVAYIPSLPSPVGSVALKTIRQSAADNFDFAVIEYVSVEFQPGQNQRKINVYLLNDEFVEQDEFFRVVLLDPVNGVLGDVTEATLKIIDDDSSYNIESNSYTVRESEGPVDITVVRKGNLTQPGSVRLRKLSGSANSGEDYPVEVLMIDFPSGVPSAIGHVKITNDNHVEKPMTETLFVELVTPQQGRLSGITRSEITITDDDSLFSFSSSLINGKEQDRRVNVTIVREGNTDRPATVYIKTTSIDRKRKRRQGSTAGKVFVPIETAITFQRGQKSGTVAIELDDDNIPETEERFGVILFLKDDDENIEIGGDGTAEITIYDDEIFQSELDFVRLDSNLFTAFEKKGSITIPIIRKGSIQHTCIIRFSTRPSRSGSIHANADIDYTPVNKVIDFHPGIAVVGIDIDIEDDTNVEDVEKFELFLSDAFGCGIQEVSSATVDIYDDDLESVRFRLSSAYYEVFENEGYLMVKVIRYGALQEAGSVYVRTINNGTAAPIADYTPVEERRIAFDLGQQSYDLSVDIIDDGIIEASKSFFVKLFNPTGGSLDYQNTEAEVVITDDDDEFEKPQALFNFKQTKIEVLESAREVEVVVLRQNYNLQTVYVAVTVESILGVNGATSSDYIITNRRIEFAAGVSSYTIVVPILDDSIPESTESFRLRLSEPNFGVLGNDADVEVHIIDDDCTFTLSDDKYMITEDGKSLRIEVVRTGFDQRMAFVGIATSYIINAALSNDFVAVSEILQFPAGRRSVSVDIRIFDDDIREANEEFEVALSNPMNGVLGFPSMASVVIIDDDTTSTSSKGGSGLSEPAIIYAVLGTVAGIAVIVAVIVVVICCMLMAKKGQRPVLTGRSVHRSRRPRPLPKLYPNRGYSGYY